MYQCLLQTIFVRATCKDNHKFTILKKSMGYLTLWGFVCLMKQVPPVKVRL